MHCFVTSKILSFIQCKFDELMEKFVYFFLHQVSNYIFSWAPKKLKSKKVLTWTKTIVFFSIFGFLNFQSKYIHRKVVRKEAEKYRPPHFRHSLLCRHKFEKSTTVFYLLFDNNNPNFTKRNSLNYQLIISLLLVLI